MQTGRCNEGVKTVLTSHNCHTRKFAHLKEWSYSAIQISSAYHVTVCSKQDTQYDWLSVVCYNNQIYMCWSKTNDDMAFLQSLCKFILLMNDKDNIRRTACLMHLDNCNTLPKMYPVVLMKRMLRFVSNILFFQYHIC